MKVVAKIGPWFCQSVKNIGFTDPANSKIFFWCVQKALKAYTNNGHLITGSSALIFSSIGTGAMFSPPAVMMISLILPVM